MIRLPCWMKLRDHAWDEPFVLQGPTRFSLARECKACGAYRVRRSVEGQAADETGKLTAAALVELAKLEAQR